MSQANRANCSKLYESNICLTIRLTEVGGAQNSSQVSQVAQIAQVAQLRNLRCALCLFFPLLRNLRCALCLFFQRLRNLRLRIGKSNICCALIVNFF